MAQEVNTFDTNNSIGGFFGSIFSGLGSLVTAAAPVAANVYQLKTQADVLKNQSAQQLASIQLQQQQLAATTKPATAATTTTATTLPTWFPYAAVAVVVLILGLVVMRFRRS
jgi:L-lactate permease